MIRSQYDELSSPLVRTMLDMEDDILREIAAQLSRDGNISDTSKWRIRQLARSGRFDKRAASIISGYSEVQGGQAMDMILTAAETEIGYLDAAVRAANTAGLAEYFSDIPAETSALNAAKAFQKQAASDMNLVNTVMRYKAKSAFVKAVNDTYLEGKKRQQVLDTMGKHSAASVMGHVSLQQATRRCIRELSQKGIPAFVDKSGREWSAEAYVMMDMRSTLGNTARAAQNTRCDQYGISLIAVSSHMGARPLCARYQGRIFSRDGKSGITTDGSGRQISYSPLSETSYGQPAGLFGINCGHVQYPFIPGINVQRYFPYPEEENSKRYEQLQRQRYLERQLRATKRECMMLNEVGDKEGLQKASLRLRNQRTQYQQFCKNTGLREHGDRTQVLGFDRSVSSKTVWAERKSRSIEQTSVKAIAINNTSTVDKSNINDIIEAKDSINTPVTPLWNKIRSFFENKSSKIKVDENDIESALKSIGFSSIDKNFHIKINKELQLSIIDQLNTLETRFGTIRKSVSPTLTIGTRGRSVASVNYTLSNPAEQRLCLSSTQFKNKKRHITDRLTDVKTFYCMPCNMDAETLSRYVITHEYGHMTENVLIKQHLIGRFGTHSEIAKQYRKEITEIAKLLDREYSESNYLSKYGQTNDKEFFAECFANSQLGQPNILGHAMRIWLERKGL